MTVSYNTKVTDAGLITFVRLFFHWKGSVWKAVYKELIFWLAAYFVLNLSFRHVMNEYQRSAFTKLCKFFRSYTDFIPLTFMLGFFVNLVVNRWWTMWENIGWIDTSSLYVNGYIGGNDERSRMFRRSIIRYLLFFQVLVFRDISTPIRKRFPTLETFVVAGYLTEQELDDYQNTPTTYKNYYTPIRWAMNLVRQARAEARIGSDLAVSELFRIIMEFRNKMGTLLAYDFQPIPLIYTVVVCLSVRLYFVSALLSRQIILDTEEEIDTVLPLMTIVQFIFFMGWMKVAEALLNPFGDDDDDFECNWLLDRNFEVGFVIAEQNQDRVLVKDKYWNTQNPEPLYSIDTVKAEVHPLIGSAARRTSVQIQHKGSLAPANTPDVIMVARTPQNANEDAMSMTSNAPCGGGAADGTKVHVRRPSRMSSVDNSSLFGGARRKLSRFAGRPFKHQDTMGADFVPEIGTISTPTDEEYIFTRGNTLRQSEREEFRRHAPSTIREEEDHSHNQHNNYRNTHNEHGAQTNEALDLVDELHPSYSSEKAGAHEDSTTSQEGLDNSLAQFRKTREEKKKEENGSENK